MSIESQKEEFEVKSAHEINQEKLSSFFSEMYPDRAELLSKHWSWFNRSAYVDNQTPLVLMNKDRLMGHAATIALDVKIGDDIHRSAWFIDLIVHPDYRGQGLATKLEKKNMSLFNLSFGFPNEKSKPLLEKVGWKSSPLTFMHYYILKPLNIHRVPASFPKFLRKTLNFFYKIIPSFIFNKYSADLSELRIDDISKSSVKLFKSLISFEQNSIIPVRDDDYFDWRIQDSPDAIKYRIVSLKNNCNVAFIIKLCTKNNTKFIDILWISDIQKKEDIRLLLSSLARWALVDEFSHIRFYTSNKNTTDFLKNTLKAKIKNPPFIYFSKNAELMKLMANSNWNWDLLDSDFEWQV